MNLFRALIQLKSSNQKKAIFPASSRKLLIKKLNTLNLKSIPVSEVFFTYLSNFFFAKLSEDVICSVSKLKKNFSSIETQTKENK